jgi:hypothetical protein
MKIITTNGKTLYITESSNVRYIRQKKINRGFFRWLILAFIFLPLVLLYFVVGETAYEFEIDNEVVLLDTWNYQRIVGFNKGE